VESVPAFVFIPKGGGNSEVIVGANAPEITKKTMLLNNTSTLGAPAGPPGTDSAAARGVQLTHLFAGAASPGGSQAALEASDR